MPAKIIIDRQVFIASQDSSYKYNKFGYKLSKKTDYIIYK